MRKVIYLLAGAFAIAPAAAAYPDKPIRLIMPYPAGGSIDTAGRAVAQKLADAFGQQIVIDNRTGAGGIIGTETGAHAVPDGYTLVMGGTGTLALSPHLHRKLSYDPVRDFAPVTMLIASPYVIVVHPSVPANSVKELIALAKARPGQINYASGGTGSAPHFASEMFNAAAGVKLNHVPYKGSTPGVIDLIGGQVQVMFTGIPSVLANIKNNRLRAIGVTGKTRTAALPDVPTVIESGVPGYVVSPWFGLLVPAHTPPAIIATLHRETVKVLRAPALLERFATEGVDPVGDTPEHFAAYIKEEIVKWGKVVKDTGMRAD
ncbi:MAG: tripartite tricarboxylate transporter substrate binding protein [Burkholderiales bacterium]